MEELPTIARNNLQCPVCKKLPELGVQVTGFRPTPGPGAYVVCGSCSAVLRVDGQGVLKLASKEDVHDLDPFQAWQILAMVVFSQNVMAEKRPS